MSLCIDCEYTASYQDLNDTVYTLIATNNELQAEVNVYNLFITIIHCCLGRLLS